MISTTKRLTHLSYALFVRGGATLALGLGAIVWPQQVMILGLLAVGAIAILVSVYEIGLAVALQRQTRWWWLVLGHGVASLTFGVLTVTAPMSTLHSAIFAISVWLLLYAGLVWATAAAVQRGGLAPRALNVWGAVTIGVAALTIFYPRANIFSLLFFGGVFAAMFGASQVAAGIWIRRELSAREIPVRVIPLFPAHS